MSHKNKFYFFILLFCLNLLSNTALLAEKKQAYVYSQAFSALKIYPTKTAPAQVIALSTASLSSEISSIVDKMNIYAGDKIEKGDILIQFNCDDYLSKLTELSALTDEVKSTLGLKKYQLGRTKKLYKSKNISEIDLKKDQADVMIHKAKLKFLQVKVQLAKKNVSRCQITSPFSGVVLKRMVTLGEMVTPGQALLTITDPKQSEVEVQLPIGLVDKLIISDRYFITQGKKYPVSLRAIIPSIETQARHQKYRFKFSGEDKNRPTLNAYGELEVTLANSFLPARLLVSRNNNPGIFLHKNGQAIFFPIKGVKPGQAFAVDLDDATKVITEGFKALSDGQTVIRLSK